jgi:hypothetical protein
MSGLAEFILVSHLVSFQSWFPIILLILFGLPSWMSCTLGNKMAHSGSSSSFCKVFHKFFPDRISHILVIWHGVWSVDILRLYNQVDTVILVWSHIFTYSYFVILPSLMMSNIACFLHHRSCHDLRTFHCQCWLSVVSIIWHWSRSCLCFCSVCNNLVGPVLPSRSYIWHWYWLHRCIVSSTCHELDNISLMVSESVMYSASIVDVTLDCILGVPFFPLLNWGHVLKHVLNLPAFCSLMCWLLAESAMFHC